MPPADFDYEAMAARIGRHCNATTGGDAEEIKGVLAALYDMLFGRCLDDDLPLSEDALDNISRLRDRKLAAFYSREAAE